MTPDTRQHGRTLVIGATGSIGRLVVRRLAELGERPVALSRDRGRAQQVLGANVDVVVGDVTDPDIWSSAVQDVNGVVRNANVPSPTARITVVRGDTWDRAVRRSANCGPPLPASTSDASAE